MTKCNWCGQDKAHRADDQRTVATCKDCETDPRYMRYLRNMLDAAYKQVETQRVRAAKAENELDYAKREIAELKLTPAERAERDEKLRQQAEANRRNRNNHSNQYDINEDAAVERQLWKDLLGR